MIRKIISCCLATLIFLTCSYIVLAEELDPEKTGTISVALIEQKQNKPIVGAELSVYYVATAVVDDQELLVFDYTKDFEPINTPIDDTSLAIKLDAFVSEYSVPSVKTTTNAQGIALCEDLPMGLYFIKQTGMLEGYAPCTSFLVTLPNEQDGNYIYEVNASPKTDIVRTTSITIKKVWNTDKSTEATKSVTVQLLQNDNVIKTAILNAQNNWQITYDDMPESDAYSIKEVNIPKGFTATYKQNGYDFIVTNSSTLIQTGQLIWPIPILAFSGMILIAIGIIILQKKRKTNA